MPNGTVQARMTPLQSFCEKWKGGCGNAICKGATHVVQARGYVPCDLLFIGEAPGTSEDTLGRPFIGPAGKLLDDIIDNAITPERFMVRCGDGTKERPIRIGFMNTVGCLPRDGEGRPTTPSVDEAEQCRPRMIELVRLMRPRAIMAVGDTAQYFAPSMAELKPVDWLPPWHTVVEQGKMIHPAAILYASSAQQSLMIRRASAHVMELAERL